METSLLFAALASDYGIAVPTSNPVLLRNRLYAERKKDIPTFGNLSITLSPTAPDTELWIVKRKETADDAP